MGTKKLNLCTKPQVINNKYITEKKQSNCPDPLTTWGLYLPKTSNLESPTGILSSVIKQMYKVSIQFRYAQELPVFRGEAGI